MASSSVSQESLDIEDYEAISSRQSRVRRARAMMPKPIEDRETPRNGDGDSDCDVIPEHESPSRSTTAASRARDKRRPNHLHKGKLPKDKRKLREKRRSTGVVNLQSTEVHVLEITTLCHLSHVNTTVQFNSWSATMYDLALIAYDP